MKEAAVEITELNAIQEPAVRVWKLILLLTALFVVTFFLTGVLWALTSWSEITTDELLWHLKMSMKGADPDLVAEFILITVGSATLVTGGACLLMLMLRRRDRKLERRTFRILRFTTVGALVFTLAAAWFGFGVGTFLWNHFHPSSFIEEEYVDPGMVEITFPEKKRNLIFIYMESMEITFMDAKSGGAFAENVIPELTGLAKENEDFSAAGDRVNGGVSLPGTIWTMGAIFGTTSGLPLKTPLKRNGMSASGDFFPGVLTLGDLLQREGYQNRLIMGSDAVFGGCQLYYETHGDFTVHDYEYAKASGRVPEDYHVWWGYEDEKLFSYAKEELAELAAGDRPFQLVLQTMDTHRPDGLRCNQCEETFDNRYANVMNCSSRRVKEFVDWAKEQDFYENTTIVITGDHPTMDEDFCENVPESYQRKTFFCVINPAVTRKDGSKQREYATLDLFPTTLAALGVRIEGDRLGLGTNLFSDRETLLEKYGTDRLGEELERRSELMERMFNGEYKSPGAE